MKICLMFALAASATSFTAPIFAQQKDTVDPKIAEQIRTLAMKFDESFNKNDASAVAALYTEDGVLAFHKTSYGRQNIEIGRTWNLQDFP
jgi:hypothetical protein